MDLALNNLQMLICHKKKQPANQHNQNKERNSIYNWEQMTRKRTNNRIQKKPKDFEQKMAKKKK